MAKTKPKILNWDISLEDRAIVLKIVHRAWPQVRDLYKSKLDLEMDIVAVHCNHMKLNLLRFAEASQMDFFHDIYGIKDHLNRQTGKLEDHFLPRCCR